MVVHDTLEQKLRKGEKAMNDELSIILAAERMPAKLPAMQAHDVHVLRAIIS